MHLKKKSLGSVRYSKTRNRVASNYSMITLKRNPKAMQIHDDFDPDTVADGIEAMKRTFIHLPT